MKVRCIDNGCASHQLTVGKEYEVLEVGGHYLINNDENESCNYFKNRFEPVEESKKGEGNMKFKVGDKVEVTDNRRSESYFDIGDKGEIIEIIRPKDGIRVKFDIPKMCDGVWMVASDQIKRINNTKFKVGDKVRAINGQYGEIVAFNILIEHPYKVKFQSGCCAHCREDELKLAPQEFTFTELYNLPDRFGKTYVTVKENYNIKSVSFTNDGVVRIQYANENRKALVVSNTCKFKLQEPKKRITIYKIEHKQDGKKYDFISSQLLQVDNFVICDTAQGKSYGRVVGSEDKDLTEQEIKQYKECWRA